MPYNEFAVNELSAKERILPRTYPFAIEYASELGMFARPDTGSEPCSYEVPSQSAAKGMIEAICRIKGASIEPIAVGICFKPSWTNYSYNSFSPIRKSEQIATDSACQIRATVLEKPRYVILGLIHYLGGEIPDKYREVNHAHSAQIQLARRVKSGRFYSPPVMGWKDFPVSDCTFPKTSIHQYNSVIPNFKSVEFDNGKVVLTARQNVEIKDGVVHYGSTHEIVVKNKTINGSVVKSLTFASENLDNMLNQFTGLSNDQ